MVCVTWMIEEHGGGNGVFGDKSPGAYLFLFFTNAIGIYIGIYIAQFISGTNLKKGFGWFTLLMACYIIFRELSLA